MFSRILATVTVISIHAPREGGDCFFPLALPMTLSFQSTPPARGATKSKGDDRRHELFQSTPPARGATFFISFLAR